MTRRPVLWILSPVYLDVESYLRVREKVLQVVAGRPDTPFAALRFVAIDDTGGLDPEFERLRSLSDVVVVAPPFNLGHQRALVFALRSLAESFAPDDYVVTMDADGEDRPEDLPELLAPLLASPGDLRKLSIAERTRRRESAAFKILYFFFRLLFRTLTGRLVRSGNFAAYRGWLVRQVLFHPNFDLCYSSSLVSLNLTLEAVPLARGDRYSGRSRMSYSRLFGHGVSMLLPFTDRIAIRSLVGAGILLAGAAASLLAAAAGRYAWGWHAPTWFWLTALLLALLSFVAIGNLILLFAAFAQARGSLLRGIEREHSDSVPGASRAPD